MRTTSTSSHPSHLFVEIAPPEITYFEKIGGGCFGTVHRGLCRGKEVAVKKLFRQDLTTKTLEDFKKEVEICRLERKSSPFSSLVFVFLLLHSVLFTILISFPSFFSKSASSSQCGSFHGSLYDYWAYGDCHRVDAKG
jgi:hypothetical protein